MIHVFSRFPLSQVIPLLHIDLLRRPADLLAELNRRLGLPLFNYSTLASSSRMVSSLDEQKDDKVMRALGRELGEEEAELQTLLLTAFNHTRFQKPLWKREEGVFPS